MNGKLANFGRHIIELRSKFREKVDDGTASKLLAYLVQFGYLTPEKLENMETLWKALGILRNLLGFEDGLAPDDILRTPFIDKLLTSPRCGCPDHFEFGTSQRKWGTNTLYYKITQYLDGMTPGEQDAVIEQAFKQWSDVCDMTFKQVKQGSLAPALNIVIATGQGATDQFDGPFGTLAWAYLPASSNFYGQLLMKFDRSEQWSDTPSERGILLLNVACHEIGHLLGLEHSQVRGALMAPFYDPGIAKPQRVDDVARIVALYGVPRTVPPVFPAPPPVPPVGPIQGLKPEHFTEEGKRIIKGWF